jgi:heme oxygenase (mycobilin-producing)
VSIIKINAITVPPEGGDELARRFAARAGAVDNQDGFEGFELLRPTDGRTTWLVVTRWRDEASFEAWLTSPAFGEGHRAAAEAVHAAHGGGHAGHSGHGGHGHGAGGSAGPAHGQDAGGQRPVGVSSELWSFEIAGGSPGGERH